MVSLKKKSFDIHNNLIFLLKGLCYLLQEIYGIENKNLTRITNDDDDDDTGSECVICICEPRDTLILPCKHLCLCNSCADSLRYQASNCPICRSPFRALLQIRAVQKSNTPIININQQDSTENIPIGFMPISLIEALNGPVHKRSSIDRKETSFGALIDKDQKSNSVETFKMIEQKCNSPETPSSTDEVVAETKKSTNSLKEKKGITKSLSLRDRDCVKYVNERSSSINVSYFFSFNKNWFYNFTKCRNLMMTVRLKNYLHFLLVENQKKKKKNRQKIILQNIIALKIQR